MMDGVGKQYIKQTGIVNRFLDSLKLMQDTFLSSSILFPISASTSNSVIPSSNTSTYGSTTTPNNANSSAATGNVYYNTNIITDYLNLNTTWISSSSLTFPSNILQIPSPNTNKAIQFVSDFPDLKLPVSWILEANKCIIGIAKVMESEFGAYYSRLLRYINSTILILINSTTVGNSIIYVDYNSNENEENEEEKEETYQYVEKSSQSVNTNVNKNSKVQKEEQMKEDKEVEDNNFSYAGVSIGIKAANYYYIPDSFLLRNILSFHLQLIGTLGSKIPALSLNQLLNNSFIPSLRLHNSLAVVNLVNATFFSLLNSYPITNGDGDTHVIQQTATFLFDEIRTLATHFTFPSSVLKDELKSHSYISSVEDAITVIGLDILYLGYIDHKSRSNRSSTMDEKREKSVDAIISSSILFLSTDCFPFQQDLNPSNSLPIFHNNSKLQLSTLLSLRSLDPLALR